MITNSYLAVGAGIGLAIGVAFNQIGVGLALGAGIGLLVGSWLNRNKFRKGDHKD